MASLLTANDRRRLIVESILPTIDLKPYVGGKRISAGGDQTVAVRDASQDSVLTQIPVADEHVVAAAVGAARAAFDQGPWPTLHPRDRAGYLLAIADLVDENAERLALLESVNAGRPISGVLSWDVPNVAEVFRYYAGWADKITGRTLPDLAGVRIATYQEPIGVCAAIMPWNFPLADLAWKLAPALAAGCTVVVKAAERAPLSAQAFAGILEQVGMPDGVVNIICGPGGTTGDRLVTDARVDRISFTGSTATARRIVERSAHNLPAMGLELGGKSPNVVLADANIAAAAAGAIGAMYSVAGQDCAAGSRLLVDRAVVDEFVALLEPHLSARILGDSLDAATQQGPQIDAAQVARIEAYVAQAIKDGAEVLFGGSLAVDRGKHCYMPTLLRNPGRDCAIWQDEVFGPVAVIETFDGLDEGLSLANDSQYGLAGGVWTTSTLSAERFVRELRAGTVWVNCYGWFDTTSPWGGRRASGQGKELGIEGIEGYLATKSVFRMGF